MLFFTFTHYFSFQPLCVFSEVGPSLLAFRGSHDCHCFVNTVRAAHHQPSLLHLHTLCRNTNSWNAIAKIHSSITFRHMLTFSIQSVHTQTHTHEHWCTHGNWMVQQHHGVAIIHFAWLQNVSRPYSTANFNIELLRNTNRKGDSCPWQNLYKTTHMLLITRQVKTE